MTAPSAYAVKIYVDGNDVTQYAPFEKMNFEDNRATVSRFTLTLENPSTAPVKGDTVFIYAISGGATVFTGYIVDVQARKRDDGIVAEYDLDCADRKIRLQKSVVPYGDYSGLDTDILDDLLGNSYPDLSSIYDFSSLANNLADSLNLAVNDDNILDMLKNLSDMAGADYRFEKGVAGAIVTFDAGGYSDYTNSQIGLSASETNGGNPDNCFKGVRATGVSGDEIRVRVNLGSTKSVTEVEFDYFYQITGMPGSGYVGIKLEGGSNNGTIPDIGVWTHIVASSDLIFTGPYSVSWVEFFVATTATGGTGVDFRIDNLKVTTTENTGGVPDKDKLVWDSTPDLSDFDLDIGSGADYGANFDLNLGSWDDYNSVIVTGGSENVSIDWTYAGNTYQNHYPLETFIKDIAVYKNTGSDASPTWTAQSLGKWGVDDRTVDGGSKDVLYDEANHWLYFNSAPATLNRTFRVTGSIKKPIRVLVETGETPVYTTTIYDENATTPEAAANIGFAALDKHAAIRRLDFETMNPGLKVGTSIHVTDTARGLDEQITIQRITVHWKGASGHAEFDVECGPDEESEADAGTLIAETDKRSRKKAAPASIGTTTASFLTDSAGNVLTDANDNPLFTVG